MTAGTLGTSLDQLESSALIRRLAEAETAYLIRHALIQETVQASLLHQERKRLHYMVGETLERIFPEQLEEIAVQLERHFRQAGDDTRTYKYAMLAGTAAQRTGAFAEAAEHFNAALTSAKRSGEHVREVYLARGRVLELRGHYEQAVENYREMRAWGEQHADRPLVLAAMIAEMTIHSIPSPTYDGVLAQQQGDETLALAHALHDAAAEAKILWNLLLLHSRVASDYELALDYGTRGLAIARANGLTEQIHYILNDISPLYAYYGEHERAEQYNLEARAYWTRTKNYPMVTDSFSHSVMNYLLAARYADAITASDASFRLSTDTNNRWGQGFSRMWVGAAYKELGEIDSAFEVMTAALPFSEFFPPILVFTGADLALLYADLGQYALAVPLAEQALALALAQITPLEAMAIAVSAQVLIRRGDLHAAERVLAQRKPQPLVEIGIYGIALPLARLELALARNDPASIIRPGNELVTYLESIRSYRHLPAARRLLALGYMSAGEPERAAESLDQARELAVEKGAAWSLWQIDAARAGLAEQQGNPQAAAMARAQALGGIEKIAARIPPQFRESFLHTPPVQNVLQSAAEPENER